MYYVSTRNKRLSYTPAEAIAQGLSREGGLFVPQVFPRLPKSALNSLKDMSYQQRAIYVMGMYLEHFTSFELTRATAAAYGPDKFDTRAVAPVRKVDDTTHCLELWHGPTCAFKDMALQMLPHLLSLSLKKTAEKKTACILVATSGDTGKGALEGFKDVEQTKILVFYPRDGVSDIQKLQMQTQEGENVSVSAVIGNFDDAQTGVKRLFSDEQLRAELAERGYFLSSANSINWGRVLPQIVYYISAYCDLLRDGQIEEGQKVNICVPTGNFGNILAAYYAKNMGLPVNKLICASNSNNVLTDFLKTGTYDRNRPFYTTVSPSMDILISSNLERLLYALSDENDVLVSEYMGQLNAEGTYTVNETILKKLHRDFAAGYADEESTKAAIAAMKKDKDYLIDTHTAVAFKVLDDYRKESGDDTVTIVASTASPFKFSDSVLSAIGVETEETGLPLLDMLSEASGVEVPAPLASLKDKTVRFTAYGEKEDMKNVVKEFLK